MNSTRKIASISAVLFSAAFVLLSLTLCLIAILRSDTANIAHDKGFIYLRLQHEENPLQLADSMTTIVSFCDILEHLNQTGFQYFELYQQPLNSDDSDAILYNNYSGLPEKLCRSATCVQISCNIQKEYDLSVSEGRLLETYDFFFSEAAAATVPVLMGSNYKGLYGVGDTFRADYLFSPFRFQVVGILASGSEISWSSSSIDLDQAIIMPSMWFLKAPTSEQEYVTQKIHYANKTSGLMKIPSSDFPKALLLLDHILANTKVGHYSISATAYGELLKNRGFNIRLILRFSLFVGVLLYSMAVRVLWSMRKCIADQNKCERKESFHHFLRYYVITFASAGICAYIMANRLGFNWRTVAPVGAIILATHLFASVFFISL